LGHPRRDVDELALGAGADVDLGHGYRAAYDCSDAPCTPGEIWKGTPPAATRPSARSCWSTDDSIPCAWTMLVAVRKIAGSFPYMPSAPWAQTAPFARPIFTTGYETPPGVPIGTRGKSRSMSSG